MRRILLVLVVLVVASGVVTALSGCRNCVETGGGGGDCFDTICCDPEATCRTVEVLRDPSGPFHGFEVKKCVLPAGASGTGSSGGITEP